MNYGLLIRNDRCIGCHACSTACKSENEVPLGVNRTWVKYVEKGTYPNVRRNFQVTRCNHCANPPCVRICPVTAMYQRDDGIVEFDPDVCIGCKACLQACPYDAIYVDPETGTAAKCHYCGHRVDLGLEPACVVVCPEHAIIAGDMDDPSSEIAAMLAAHPVSVRKPEQGTSPKLFYVDGDETALTPTATERTPQTFMWADVLPLHGGDGAPAEAKLERETEAPAGLGPAGGRRPRMSASGERLRPGGHQGAPEPGPITIGEGRMADGMIQVAYNAQHLVPWHWPVPAYLVTKGIAAGIFLLLAIGVLSGLVPYEAPGYSALALAVLAFLVVTTALLVFDLERPERFLRIITRPQWDSWLVRGAFILIAFSALSGGWWLLETLLALGLIGQVPEIIRQAIWGIGIPLATGTAVYTAFLFGQAEGRDLWQSTLLPVHLLLQAAVAGAAGILLLTAVADLPPELVGLARWVMLVGLPADLAVTLGGEFGMPHASEAAARAAKEITHGRYARSFWWGAVLAGHILPVILLLVPESAVASYGAAMLALAGLWLYEYAFVMAPQDIPNS